MRTRRRLADEENAALEGRPFLCVPKQRAQLDEQLAGDLRMLEQKCPELPRRHPEDPELRLSRHRCASRPAVDDRDVAERLPRPECAQPAAVPGNDGRAVEDELKTHS